tara:strand:+ start:1603 stop:2406 length:804 start_codon:yes stop_codon:yes gene_type:complete
MAVTINGTTGVTFADSSNLPSATFSPVYPITASVGSSALTVTLNPCSLVFRSSTLTSGTTATRTVSAAISVVVPSTATLGTVSAQQSRIIVLAIDNAGTVELAVVNVSGGSVLDETTLITTTAIAAASNSATAYYSTTARTSVAYRVVGYVESTQATAGTWATAPSTIQGYGGQALSAMSSLGYGQTWQNVFASRASGTTYYNTTGKPIYMIINSNLTAGATLTINGTVVYTSVANPVRDTSSFVIPVGVSYVYTASTAIYTWSELR